MPWSIPIAKPIGFILGVAAGEVVRAIAKEMGSSEDAARVASIATSGLVGMTADAALSSVLIDPVGAATSPASGVGSALATTIIDVWLNG